VQKANGDRVEASLFQRFGNFRDLLFVERPQRFAACKRALLDLENVLPRDERTGATLVEIARLGAVAAADRIDVFCAARDEQRGARALAFDQRIDGDRGAMDETIDLGEVCATLMYAVENALGQILRSRQALAVEHLPGSDIDPHQIGEGSTNINCK
jgi:hypothetical protein